MTETQMYIAIAAAVATVSVMLFLLAVFYGDDHDD